MESFWAATVGLVTIGHRADGQPDTSIQRDRKPVKGAAILHDIVTLLLFGAMILAPCIVAHNTGVLHFEEENETPGLPPFPAPDTSDTLPLREASYRRTYLNRKLQGHNATSTTQPGRDKIV